MAAFTETKQIEVGPNPGKIAAGRNHAVWVATYGEEIEKGDYHLVKINTQSDAVEAVYDEPVMDFAISIWYRVPLYANSLLPMARTSSVRMP